MTNGIEINRNTPALAALQMALDQGDIAQVRRQLTQLNENERETLRHELGDAQFDLVYRLIRRAPRGSKKGHVVVLHGIMGGTLAVKKKNDVDNVWVNFWRLFNGRIADLKLNTEGNSADPDVQVLVTGQQKKYYLPMVLKLDQNWNVLPFAYDWRGDIAASAESLAQAIKSFSHDQPVHLVAHSMGGLVSRYMIRKNPDLWQRMADGENLTRGGRLIMLGTPNHGSFSIPLALTGEEKQVKLLAKIDRANSLKDLLEITNTFPGSYQMLPSSLVDLGDDHHKLYDPEQWGDYSIRSPLLQRAAQFHDELNSVIDTRRFLYVAGYNRETPHRIRIAGPGQFEYLLTQDGDGRVPHDLGLLDGVPTFWADATHGDLARDPDVLDSIDDLLEKGQTSVLSSVKPMTRATTDIKWHDASDFEEIDNDVLPLLSQENRNRGGTSSSLNDEQHLLVENELLKGYLGDVRQGHTQHRRRAQNDGDGKPPKLRVEVVWGDITQCEGQVYAVGHYQGVLPQAAELALDAAISNDPKRLNPDTHILRQHTLRGTLRGALGDVDFFPWLNKQGQTRTVAVAGMGRVGSFTPSAMRTMARKLAWAISSLRGIDTVCTVLIGSGEGTLTIDEALRGLALGLADVLNGEMGRTSSSVRTVRIVELFRDRAQGILDSLTQNKASFGKYLELDIPDALIRGDNARISSEDGLGLMLEALLKSSIRKSGDRRRDLFDEILKVAARGRVPKAQLQAALSRANWTYSKTEPDKPRFYVSQRPEAGNQRVPFRLSYLTENDDIRVAAISDTATVAERVLKFDRRLVEEVSAEVMDVDAPLRDATPGFLRKLVVPQEFGELIDRGGSFVFEVDRNTAQIPWEILASGSEIGHEQPLAIRAQVARQMRTTYSGSPTTGGRSGRNIRALIIGDPGDPLAGHNLPGAEREAFAVYDLLRKKNIDVDLVVGAPGSGRTGRLRDFPAASRGRVMEKLLLENYQMLHYCGHGSFDEQDASRAGWLFADGLLTAYELERLSAVPGLVIANACLSGRTSQRAAGLERIRRSRDEAALLPSLADEFFRRGVINYIGTAWEVSDEGAVLFALTIYEALLSRPGAANGDGKHNKNVSQTAPASVGDAVSRARCVLYDKRDIYGKLWAAYQHYGDPTSPLVLSAADHGK